MKGEEIKREKRDKGGGKREYEIKKTKRTVMNLYRGFAYQKGRLHRALGYCLSYRGTCTRHALYNKARVAVTADYSHYPPTVIRIQTITESGAFAPLARQTY